MEQIKFPNKESLKKWAISTVGIAVTSIALLGDLQKIEFSFTNPKAISAVIESSSSYFPEGEYLVSYKSSSNDDQDDIDYSKMVMVVSFQAMLANSNTLIGGLQPLIEGLADFEYSSSIDKTNPAYVTAGIWVVEPKNPAELEELKLVLEQYAVFYAFNDGSGFVTLNNARMGNGVSNRVQI